MTMKLPHSTTVSASQSATRLARFMVMTSLAPLLLTTGGCDSEGPTQTLSVEPVVQSANLNSRPDLTTATLHDLQQSMLVDGLTSEALVRHYLERIDKLDRNGPQLRAVISLNPDALQYAKASDQRRRQGATLGNLDGIPVLVKDNIETADPIATTAGSTALLNNISTVDSPIIAKLRQQGAVILGKTNLSQWANFRSDFSVSGWSSVGGQVKNPHVLDRSPCGSSSGSGVAVAAGLATLAIGTETNGSIICPSNVNGVVGFKPTLGLLPQAGIVPIAPSQDTAGPMARTVVGAAQLLDAMAGTTDYSNALTDDTDLSDITVAVLRFAQGDHPEIIARFDRALAILATAGATLVEVDEFAPTDKNLSSHELLVLETEFKTSVNNYLATTPATVASRSLSDLITFNNAHARTELPLFGQEQFIAANHQAGMDEGAYLLALAAIKAATGSEGIDTLLKQAKADILVAPSGPISPPRDAVNGDVWPSWVGVGYLPAIAGYPHLSVPMGTVKGIPLGLSFIASANEDSRLLRVGNIWQRLHGPAPTPTYLSSANDESTIKSANEPQ